MRRSLAAAAVPVAFALAPALALAGIFALSGCTSPGDDPGTAMPVDPAAIYASNCARCHGADGRGDPQMKLTLPVRDFTDPAFRARARTEDMERVIMAGKGQMPPFGSALSQPKIQALAGHIKRLGAAAVR